MNIIVYDNDKFVQLVAQLIWKHNITLIKKIKDKEIHDIIFIETNSNLYNKINKTYLKVTILQKSAYLQFHLIFCIIKL